MMRLLINWLVTTGAIMLAAYIIPGVAVRSIGAAFVGAAVFGLLNLFLKPILGFLAFPITFLTLGLFTFVINACLFWLAAKLVEGFRVESFWSALFGALIVSVVSVVTNAGF
jgi:putative membrane protein